MLLLRASELRTPILMLLGGQDPVIDPVTSREFFDRLGSDDKTLHFYPKMLHEPLNELGREQVYDDVVRWLAPGCRHECGGGSRQDSGDGDRADRDAIDRPGTSWPAT